MSDVRSPCFMMGSAGEIMDDRKERGTGGFWSVYNAQVTHLCLLSTSFWPHACGDRRTSTGEGIRSEWWLFPPLPSLLMPCAMLVILSTGVLNKGFYGSQGCGRNPLPSAFDKMSFGKLWWEHHYGVECLVESIFLFCVWEKCRYCVKKLNSSYILSPF